MIAERTYKEKCTTTPFAYDMAGQYSFEHIFLRSTDSRRLAMLITIKIYGSICKTQC